MSVDVSSCSPSSVGEADNFVRFEVASDSESLSTARRRFRGFNLLGFAGLALCFTEEGAGDADMESREKRVLAISIRSFSNLEYMADFSNKYDKRA